MKKIILILFFSAVSFSIGLSQTTPWISSGATWYYQWDCGWQLSNTKIEYINDTIHYGKNCQELKVTQWNYLSSPPYSLVSTQTNTRYTYSNVDTVFYLVDSTFKILYNFGASAGDIWDVGTDTSATFCDNSVVKVDSISTIIIGSNTHRVLYLSDSLNSSALFSSKVIEHIGSTTYLFPFIHSCDSSATIDYCTVSFSCFSDSLLSYSTIPATECANPYHTGIDEQAVQGTLEIFPNPAENAIRIGNGTSDASTLYIFDAMGRVLYSRPFRFQSETVNVENLTPGLYFVKLKSEKGNFKNGKFVKQ